MRSLRSQGDDPVFFLDSDICIDLLRGKLPETYEVMKRSNPKLFAICAVVEAELRTGAQKSDHPKKNLFLLETFLAPFQRIPFDSECAMAYAKVRSQLEREGCPIGPNDTLIAATVLAHNGTLITGNVREFSRVQGLELEDWAEVSLDRLS